MLGIHRGCNFFSWSVQENAQRMENVLQNFDKENLQVHPGKCVFAQTQCNYLAFVLSEKGACASPYKMKALKN